MTDGLYMLRELILFGVIMAVVLGAITAALIMWWDNRTQRR